MDTRETILDTAAGLLQTRGYNGFSFQDVADRVGVRKPSLYHHFASKEALGLSIVRRAIAGFEEFMRQVSGQGARYQLESWFRLYQIHITPGRMLCAAGGIITAGDTASDALRARARHLLDTQQHWLERVCVEGGWAAEGGDAQQLATWLLTSVQGALLVSRVYGDARAFDNTLGFIRQQLSL